MCDRMQMYNTISSGLYDLYLDLLDFEINEWMNEWMNVLGLNPSWDTTYVEWGFWMVLVPLGKRHDYTVSVYLPSSSTVIPSSSAL
jgi:hypothetical protein